jgi:hypothetical protein
LNRNGSVRNPLGWTTRRLQSVPRPKPLTTKEIIMLDDLLNSIAFTVVVAIAAAAAANFQPPVLADQAEQAARVAEVTAPAVESPVTVVQLPTVLVVGHRERAAESLSVATAD